jgi:hypothetical protein
MFITIRLSYNNKRVIKIKERVNHRMSYLGNNKNTFDQWGKTNQSLFETNKKNNNKYHQLSSQLQQ